MKVIAASDFFSFNVQRREDFDEFDRSKGNREALVDGPTVEPWLEDPGDARRRIDDELNAGGGTVQRRVHVQRLRRLQGT
jgi:hypothetical protein